MTKNCNISFVSKIAIILPISFYQYSYNPLGIYVPFGGFLGIQSNASNFMGFGPECSREIPFNFDCLRSGQHYPGILFLLTRNILLLSTVLGLFLFFRCTSLLPDRAGGRRQKTLLICNPPLPLTQVFTQTSFHSFQRFLLVQPKGVHFRTK